MAAQKTTLGLDLLVNYLLGKIDNIELWVGVYTNNFTPARTTLFSHLENAPIEGAAPQLINPDNWIGITDGLDAQYTNDQVEFVFEAYAAPIRVIRGYYVFDAITETLIWLENFHSVFFIPIAGGSTRISVTYASQECP